MGSIVQCQGNLEFQKCLRHVVRAHPPNNTSLLSYFLEQHCNPAKIFPGRYSKMAAALETARWDQAAQLLLQRHKSNRGV